MKNKIFIVLIVSLVASLCALAILLPAQSKKSPSGDEKKKKEGTPLPDLVINQIYMDDNGYIHYRVRNKGTASTGSSFKVRAVVGPPNTTLGPESSGKNIRRYEYTENILQPKSLRTGKIEEHLEGSYTVLVIADTRNEVFESDENNNSLIVTLSHQQLKVKNVIIHRNNQADTYISFKIKNKGPATILNYYALVGITGGGGPLHSFPVSGHVSGDVRAFTINTEILPVGEHEAIIRAHQGLSWNTLILSNWIHKNYRKLPHSGLPDLKIKNVTRHNNNSPIVNIKFKVKNKGSANSPGYTIRYNIPGGQYVPPPWGQHWSVRETYPALPAGSTRQHMVSHQLPIGHYTLAIMVDPDNDIVEEKEDNNLASKSYKKPS